MTLPGERAKNLLTTQEFKLLKFFARAGKPIILTTQEFKLLKFSARRARKELKQFEFLSCEYDGFARARRLHAGKVDSYIAERQQFMLRCFWCDGCAMWGGWFAAAHRTTHTGEQLFRTKGLCNVVVRTKFEKQNLVLDFRVGAQYDDGD